MSTPEHHPSLLRPVIPRSIPAWILVAGIFLVHTAVRFGGLSEPSLIPLSMVLLWPLPWILSPKAGRRAVGLRLPDRLIWFVFGTFAAAASIAACALVAWGVFGDGGSNWFVHHALMLRDSLGNVPSDTSAMAQFWMVTGPAMIFSPLGEEFLFRGYLMESVTRRWNVRTGLFVQAAAFALAHLAQFGLAPLQPLLILVWVPSMFAVAVVLGWIVRRSGSLWPAVVGHAVVNLLINLLVFWQMPGFFGL